MLRTIEVGTSAFVQGTFVSMLPDGRMKIRVFDRFYAGMPMPAFTQPNRPETKKGRAKAPSLFIVR